MLRYEQGGSMEDTSAQLDGSVPATLAPLSVLLSQLFLKRLTIPRLQLDLHQNDVGAAMHMTRLL